MSWLTDGLSSIGLWDKPPTQYKDQTQIDRQIRHGLGRTYTAPPVDTTRSDQFRQQQLAQIQQLQGIASGSQQGAGELAAQRQVQNAMAGQQAAARMARGNNAALAYRQGANNQAAVGLSGAGQAQQAALQDQQTAQGQLMTALGQGRGQDQQVSLANLQAQMQAQGLTAQQQLAYLQQLTGMDANQLAAAQNAANSSNALTGGLISMGGQLLTGGGLGMGGPKPAGMSWGSGPAPNPYYSDERLKTDVSDAGPEIDSMLDALIAKRYRYRDEAHGKGSRVGIMAQDLRRSKAGADITRDTPEGIALDPNAAVSAALAGLARVNERLRKVESSK